MTRVKSRTQSSDSLKSEITVEITVFSRNLKHFSVYCHPRLIIALKSQLKSRNLVHKINPCHTPRSRSIDHQPLTFTLLLLYCCHEPGRLGKRKNNYCILLILFLPHNKLWYERAGAEGVSGSRSGSCDQ